MLGSAALQSLHAVALHIYPPDFNMIESWQELAQHLFRHLCRMLCGSRGDLFASHFHVGVRVLRVMFAVNFQEACLLASARVLDT